MSEGESSAKRRITCDVPPKPTGISKKQWKRQWKLKQFELNKEVYAARRRDKRRKAKERRREIIKEYEARGEPLPEELVRIPRININQTDSGMKLIIDCGFDDLMNDKEIVSLSNQITRAYSANRRADHYAEVDVSSFDKRLATRFNVGLKDSNHKSWDHFSFHENDIIAEKERSNLVYLTADTEDELETLEPGTTYIIGGIVDKNRHKELCLNKAKDMTITPKRLPLTKYVKLDGRQVLTTGHVVQLMLKYFDNHDWKEAIESVIPQRKIDQVATLNQEERAAALQVTDSSDSGNEEKPLTQI
ncbi:tRNA (guanine(9)-N(1))-methyltransferase KNAG_0K00750 [Huiozyma naganishii CBS 8797]|uniref:tRNA (guanine(9)-N1)-methyltransferase n=1 Tax=Huiozyma naganishii (strain ATCC MYA-139 / BCRC 22969 / CBS 8797 / KCTC 17520 / NBRC 10181 / NCYC 3082 / Yp74L-3) TaxID=1071383 RepID=J7RRF7_HUIN7|nr:hypothetical protein KNAG_0K00750 [Kazachstania naganishii CBS 8797]CCK72443.1 hypothetical protein KNAG_0K00750 [Kazachstania naganishii CBS 8797]